MRKKFARLFAKALLLSFIGASAHAQNVTQKLDQPKLVEGSFNKQLHESYVNFLNRERETQGQAKLEWAEYKAAMAAKNETPLPESPVKFHFISPETESEVKTAYFKLLIAFSDGSARSAPYESAKAQVAYDCWVNAEYAKGFALAKTCEIEFEGAMTSLATKVYPAFGSIPLEISYPPKISDTVYGFIKAVGGEAAGYSLYSYALFPSASPRAQRFLQELFRENTAAGDALIAPRKLNIVYLPTKSAWDFKWRPSKVSDEPGPKYLLENGYSFPLAKLILSQLCVAPSPVLSDMCKSDLSRGPYVLTYTQAVSRLGQIPPPFLILDLSNVHEDAFSEYIAAYKEQVKRSDYTDRDRIDTFRLRLLKVIVPASKLVDPTIEKWRSVKAALQ